MSLPLLYALSLATATAGGTSLRIYDLPDIPVGAPWKINNAGAVVLEGNEGFVYQAGRMHPLPPGAFRARSINDLGELAGIVAERATLFQPAPGFMSRHEYTLVDIGDGQGVTELSEPVALNNRPTVLGYGERGGAAIWTRETGAFFAWSGFPASINQRGDATGQTLEASFPGNPGLVRFFDGTVTTFGSHVGPSDINEGREVVGGVLISPNPNVTHGFRWQSGVLTELFPLPGHNSSYASALNNHGLVIGSSSGEPGTVTAVRWDSNGVTALNDDVPVPGYQLFHASDVNDHGQIIGLCFHLGIPRSFLLTPESKARAVYRLYNPRTLEHLLTTDANEYAVLGTRGWVQEGRAFAVADSPGPYVDDFPIPLYRLYHTGSQQHLYTTDPHEAVALRDVASWAYEAIAGFVFLDPVAGSRALHRLALASPPLHHWTVDENEVAVLVSRGWLDEGITGYVLDESAAPLDGGEEAAGGARATSNRGDIAAAAPEP